VTSRVDQSALDAGQALIDAERYDDAMAHFEAIAEELPGDPRVLFHLGGAYDAAGEEEKAVGPYRDALAGGLDEEEAFRASIQLASTLRNLERHEEAVQILTEVCMQRPGHRAARAFLALALTSGGEPTRGVAELLDVMLSSPGPIEAYNRSLRWYADDLAGRAD
jgi:cyanophycin synthetase